MLQATSAKAEAATAVSQAVQLGSGTKAFENLQTAETPLNGSDTEAGVRLYTRDVSSFFTSIFQNSFILKL